MGEKEYLTWNIKLLDRILKTTMVSIAIKSKNNKYK